MADLRKGNHASVSEIVVTKNLDPATLSALFNGVSLTPADIAKPTVTASLWSPSSGSSSLAGVSEPLQINLVPSLDQ
jgi:hypothetical protein